MRKISANFGVRTLATVGSLVSFGGFLLPDLAHAQFLGNSFGDCVACNSLGLQGGGSPMNGALASSLQDFGRVLPHSGLILGQPTGGGGAFPMLPVQSGVQPYNGMPLQGGLFGAPSQLWIPGQPMPGAALASPSVLAANYPNRFETPYYSAQSGGLTGSSEFAPWVAMDQFPVNPAVKLSTLPELKGRIGVSY